MGDRLLKSRSGNVVNEDGIKFHSQQYALTVNGTNWITDRARGNVYSLSDGAGGLVWRMTFNISGTFSIATAAAVIAIDDVVVKNIPGSYQSVATWASGGCAVQSTCYATIGGNSFNGTSTSAKTIWGFSGDIELNAKPSFVA